MKRITHFVLRERYEGFLVLEGVRGMFTVVSGGCLVAIGGCLVAEVVVMLLKLLLS